jgi:hypothetical protein
VAFEVRFDFSNFVKLSVAMDGANSQLRYVAANPLNEAAFKCRETLINSTWPRSVKVKKGVLSQRVAAH